MTDNIINRDIPDSHSQFYCLQSAVLLCRFTCFNLKPFISDAESYAMHVAVEYKRQGMKLLN